MNFAAVMIFLASIVVHAQCAYNVVQTVLPLYKQVGGSYKVWKGPCGVPYSSHQPNHSRAGESCMLEAKVVSIQSSML